MSTSGIYNYWPKVNNPNADFKQMTSGGFQPPFFLGGSQIPINLGMEKNHLVGSGVHGYVSHIHRAEDLPVSCKTGRGLNTTASKSGKIFLPKHAPTLYK